MNIRSVSTLPILPTDPKNRAESGVRAKSSTERDGNGKQEQPEGETKRNLTDAELEEALRVLKELPGLKANDLLIKIETQEDTRVILIVDHSGKVIRRLTEGQLWLATRDKDRPTGAIFDKSA